MTVQVAAEETRDGWATQRRRINENFVVSTPDSDESGRLLESISELDCTLTPGYSDIARAFRSNIQGLLLTVSTPFRMAQQAVMSRHHSLLLVSEHIKADFEPGKASQEQLDAAQREAREKLLIFAKSEDGSDALAREVCGFLDCYLVDASIASSMQELLRQGAVLSWGAFEVLARDTFIQVLNENPQFCERLLSHGIAKKRFDASKVSLETLVSYGFDLTRQMGHLLSQQQDLSDLASIRATYSALFDTEALAVALADQSLWTLSQLRHLVVHRCGVVDQRFANSTDTTQVLGSRVSITARELEVYIRSCIAASREILVAASTLGDASGG